MAVLDDIRTQFPFLAWLVDDPEVGPLLSQAVDPNTTFSQQRFEAELMKTNWWQSRSQTRRAWEILTQTDPAQANQERTSMMDQIITLGNQLGISVTWDQVRWIAESMLQQGMGINDPRVRRGIISLGQSGAAGTHVGLIPTLTNQVNAIGKYEFFYNMHAGDARSWANMIAEGTKTLDDLRSELQKQSISMYPHLQEELSQGRTMREIFSGHINTIANELELAPEEIDLTQGQWLKVLDMHDPATQTHRPLTLSETRTLARQDQRFWSTANGRALDSSMTNNLLRTFGMRR